MRVHYNNRDTNDLDPNCGGFNIGDDYNHPIPPIIYFCPLDEFDANLYSEKIVRIYDVFSQDASNFDVPLKAVANPKKKSRSKKKKLSDSEDEDQYMDDKNNKDTIID